MLSVIKPCQKMSVIPKQPVKEWTSELLHYHHRTSKRSQKAHSYCKALFKLTFTTKLNKFHLEQLSKETNWGSNINYWQSYVVQKTANQVKIATDFISLQLLRGLFSFPLAESYEHASRADMAMKTSFASVYQN